MVTDYHAIADGIFDNTLKFQNALKDASKWNAANDNRGVNILFPIAGHTSIFLTAPINLTSHVTLTVASGVTLLASDDESLWPVVPPLISYGTGRDHAGPRRAPFIGGLHLKDVVITGPGTIDGAGQAWWQRHQSGHEKYTRGRLIEFLWTDGILIDDIQLTNSPFWTVHPTYCSNVVARHLYIDNPIDAPNTDGFDPDSTINVSLVDSIFSVGDDGVAIKSGWDCYGIDVGIPTKNVRGTHSNRQVGCV